MIIYIYLFIIGLILGSFYNVVGLRIPNNQSISYPPSHCPSCQKKLSPLELIPVISYIFLKGKCKGCGVKVSPLYPIVELMTGSLFALSFYVFGLQGELFVSLTLVSLFMIIFVSDMTYMVIPDKVLLFFTLIFSSLRIWITMEPWWDPLLGAFIGFTLLFLLAVVSRGGMGGGDVKLFAVIGLVLGWKGVLLALFLSTLYGSIVGIIGLIIGKVERGKPIPFGPFIALGALTTYFFGNEIMTWYFNYL
jgi:leader peptidase (prepilin peptidase) / N-methyltransferase